MSTLLDHVRNVLNMFMHLNNLLNTRNTLRIQWEQIHLNYARSMTGKTILTSINTYCNWIEINVINETITLGTIAILDKLCVTYDVPLILILNKGTQFTARL